MKKNKNVTYTNDKFTLTLYLCYIIFYTTLIWGLTASAIYFLHWSGWLVLLAIILMSEMYDYKSFYIKMTTYENEDKDMSIDITKK